MRNSSFIISMTVKEFTLMNRAFVGVYVSVMQIWFVCIGGYKINNTSVGVLYGDGKFYNKN